MTEQVTLEQVTLLSGPWDFDLHTVARGVDECNYLISQGWRVYHAEMVVHELVAGSPQRGAIRQPMPYYLMGKKLSDEETANRAALAQAAAENSDAALSQPMPAEPDEQEEENPAGSTVLSEGQPSEPAYVWKPEDEAAKAPPGTSADPPSLPAGRGASGLETTGIRRRR